MALNNTKIRCLFVHGWGMNHMVWQPVLDKLPDWIDARAIDLPGHGQRAHESFHDMHSLSLDLESCINEHKTADQPMLVVAWSLGALPCLQLMSEGFGLIDKLLVVSSNPCFVTRNNWECGISADVFDQFAESLKDDFSGTIRRFLSLQVKGSESGRVILRGLREKVLQQPQPDEKSLDAGLEILKQVDLREQLVQIKQPVSWALGGQDGLVKAGLSSELENLMSGAEVNTYPKAGHAPFLSHTDEFVKQLIAFAQSTITKSN